MNVILKISFTEKLTLFITALRKDIFIIALGLFFIFIGLALFNIEWFYHLSGGWVLYVISLIFMMFPTFILIWTLPSSILYSYDQCLTKKYGVNIEAIVTNKRKEENIYVDTNFEGNSISSNSIKEFNYIIEYKYFFINHYESEYYIGNNNFYDKIELGSTIPIKVLKIKPKVSFPRLIKLGKEFNLKKKDSF